MSIFKKLWNGEICIAENCVPQTEEYHYAAHSLSQASESLEADMTEKQKQSYEAYQNARADYEILLQINVYRQGVKLGYELAQELSKED